jgi:diguanylate cyclase (GGDEF)-like protein
MAKRNRADIQSAVFLAILLIAGASHIWEFNVFHGALGQIQSANSVNLIETLVLLAVLNAGFLVFTTYHLEHWDATKRCDVAEREAHRLALEDALTGLPNRRLFEDTIRAALASPPDSGASHAVFLLDLNEFKRVNDLHGHPTGDQVLCQVANRLRNAVSAEDIVARTGGDEFGIVAFHLPGPEAATAIARRIMGSLAQSISIGARRLQVGAAIGIVLLPQDGTTAEEVLRKADTALYRAKGGARPGFRFFEAEMDRALREFDLLERELRKAIDTDMIRPFYQPQIDLASNTIVGFEVLARWTHPTLGEIEPGRFIPVAEESGLINELSLRLLRQACRDANAWPDHVQLSFNLSPVQLRDSTQGSELLRILTESGFPSARFEIEITENTLVRDIETVRTELASFRQAGVQIALDDFGTGYSSLFHLRSFTPDKIKIDRSFVSAMTFDRGSEEIVRALIGLGSGLRLTVTAEGVETRAQQSRLRALGCPFGQGFLFSRAVPAAEAARMVASGADKDKTADVAVPALPRPEASRAVPMRLIRAS